MPNRRHQQALATLSYFASLWHRQEHFSEPKRAISLLVLVCYPPSEGNLRARSFADADDYILRLIGTVLPSCELLPESLFQRGIACSDADKLDSPTVRLGGVGYTDRQVTEVAGFAQPLEPFDGRDRIGKQILAQAEVVERNALEAIEIDVKQRQTAPMLLNHREGGTQYPVFVEIEPAREALDKAGLADAEVASKAK